MEHRAVMSRSQSTRRIPAEAESNRTSDLRGSLSLSFMSSSGWFNKGKVDSTTSMKNEEFGYEPKKAHAESSTGTTATPQQQQLRVQEITQSHCLEQRFLSKMRESGVVTSAGYQAVLRDFVASDRKGPQTDAAAADNESPGTTSIKIDRRAEMLKARKSSSRRSSSRRFSSFFTACPSSYEDEDFAFINDVSENTAASAPIADGRAEMLNSRRRSCRRGSSRRFGSFFTAAFDDDDLFDSDSGNRAETNIAPLRQSVQLTQEQIDYIQNAADDDDDSQSSLSITSSLSDSIHINNDHDDERSIERLEKRIEDGNRNASISPRQDSSTSLNLEEVFDGIEESLAILSSTLLIPSKHSSDQAAEAEVPVYTASINFDPTHSKKNAASTSEEQERSNLGSSESSCTLDECAWLPWPERRPSIVEDKDNDSRATKQALYDDNSFLPWPESPRNGRAMAA
mmetsp:Transcript_25330/g.38301  ORF Transcript_25330/g.38301 Transcript_25330/m.38301 type:complete len:456 (+) Transcript_25330:76-1443(+)